jgi:DNA-binding response OmpR family regulator
MYHSHVIAAARILIADDDVDSREIYSEILSLAGHSVITVADGEEAIAYALRVPFDLIILDLCLPKIDGIRVIKEVRSSLATRSTPIITVSAGDELIHRQALAAGADVALMKPCLPEELRAAVSTFFSADCSRDGKEARARTRG